MKKWIAPSLSLLLIALLLLISSPFNTFKASMNAKESGERPGILLPQGEGKKEQVAPHLILVSKRLRKTLDEWQESINDRIENENITDLEVRFLEILRSMLEWVREKVDAKIESFERGKPKQTHQKVFSIPEVG